jgi:hypothetical protein
MFCPARGAVPQGIVLNRGIHLREVLNFSTSYSQCVMKLRSDYILKDLLKINRVYLPVSYSETLHLNYTKL